MNLRHFLLVVKLSIAIAVMVGVAAALTSAFLVVALKCCWVWWRYKRKRPSKQDYKSYTATPRTPLPADYTYSTYENQQIEMGSFTGEGPEPYIIESPTDLGKLQLSLEHEIETNLVTVGFVQAKGIISKSNPETAFLFIQIKLCVNGIVLHEQKLKKQKMSFDPHFNEELAFQLEEQTLDSVDVLVQLMELDSFSNTHLIGQVLLPLGSTDMSVSGPAWHDLTVEQKVSKILKTDRERTELSRRL